MRTGKRAPRPGRRAGWVPARAVVIAALVAATWGARRWRPSWVRVEGPSMSPLLPPGAVVVTTPVPRRGARVGQVVVAVHPHRPELELIKRVVARTPGGTALWLGGDDPARSTDSDRFGAVASDRVRGIARLRLRPWPPVWLGADPDAIRPRAGSAGGPCGPDDLRP